jgi:hypothetical protein
MVKREQVLRNILAKMEAERDGKMAFMQRNIITEILDNKKNAVAIVQQDNPDASAFSRLAARERELFALAKKQTDEREQTYQEIAILDDEIAEINQRIFYITQSNRA